MNAPEDALAELLRVAAGDPGQRPEFYRALLDSTVFVIGRVEGDDSQGRAEVPPGARLSLQNWQRPDGSPVIPFFSSLGAMKRAIQSEVHYLAVPARSLFEMTRGAALVLNPRSDHGKELLPSEIASLLQTGVIASPEQRVVPAATQVFLGQPREYPSILVSALTTLFSKHRNVKAAYLALMHDPSVDAKPHLVIGVEADGDFERVIRDAGAVVVEVAKEGDPVDFVRIEQGQRGLSEYLTRSTKPFYERSWGSRMKSVFGFGRA